MICCKLQDFRVWAGLIGRRRAVGRLTDLRFFLGGSLLVVENAVGHPDRAIAKCHELWVALVAPLMNLAVD